MKVKLEYPPTKTVWETKETSTLKEMQSANPLFFNNSPAFGENETYTVYRGQLICQIDTVFGGVKSRKTAVYLFVNGNDFFCLGCSPFDSDPEEEMQLAKETIDKVFETGFYQDFSRRGN